MTATHPLVATYRVQLTPSFGFAAVAELLPDLAALGISHLYLSPVAEAVTGSTHGYDVVDPTLVRDELGGRDGLLELGRAATAAGIGLVIDIVPNHVSTAEPERNRWWWNVLRDGPGAPQATWFDIDWELAGGRVIVPTLGAPLADVLAAGELRVGPGILRYHERTFPLRTGEPVADGHATDLAATAELVGRQHYRLQFWRERARNVRRFFTIDDLVAVRPEVPAVAAAVHTIVSDLAGLGLLDGVRVDHIDGLADPAGYLHGLRATVGDGRWIGVEKILVGDERLPPAWPVQGTTGYEWIRVVDHLFTHPGGEAPLTRLWHDVTGDRRGYHEHEREGVRAVLEGELRPDLDRVVRAAAGEIPGADPDALREAITALTVHLGRYRTYLAGTAGAAPEPGDGDRPPGGPDGAVIRRTAAAAGADGGVDATALERLVTAILAGGATTVRWQQLTGPALAKGGEDRALYRWFRLAAHNEVGGDPGRWTLPLDEFHAHNAHVAAHWPTTLLAGSTHDTKRSEDVRARLLVLSELGERWPALVAGWRETVGSDAPDGPALLLALQTAVGAWPIDAERLGDYLVKAAREAATATTWADPDERYEAALHRLAGRVVAAPLGAEIERFVEEIAPAAGDVAVAQLVLRATAPGVPDVYQGGESWLRTLVDPDNRAPIDRARLHAAATAAGGGGPVWASSPVKAAVLARVLATRRRFARAFAAGSGYTPLTAAGDAAEHTVAFARSAAGGGPDPATVVTVAARYPRSRPDGWAGTTLALPAGEWHDALAADGRPWTGRVELDLLLAQRPAALLVPAGP